MDIGQLETHEKKYTKRTRRFCKSGPIQVRCWQNGLDLVILPENISKIPDFLWFFANFNGLVLEAQTELDKTPGHFWYLLIVKRSFLGLVAAPSDSRRSRSHLKAHRVEPIFTCTSPDWGGLCEQNVSWTRVPEIVEGVLYHFHAKVVGYFELSRSLRMFWVFEGFRKTIEPALAMFF